MNTKDYGTIMSNKNRNNKQYSEDEEYVEVDPQTQKELQRNKQGKPSDKGVVKDDREQMKPKFVDKQNISNNNRDPGNKKKE